MYFRYVDVVTSKWWAEHLETTVPVRAKLLCTYLIL